MPSWNLSPNSNLSHWNPPPNFNPAYQPLPIQPPNDHATHHRPTQTPTTATDPNSDLCHHQNPPPKIIRIMREGWERKKFRRLRPGRSVESWERRALEFWETGRSVIREKVRERTYFFNKIIYIYIYIYFFFYIQVNSWFYI